MAQRESRTDSYYVAESEDATDCRTKSRLGARKIAALRQFSLSPIIAVLAVLSAIRKFGPIEAVLFSTAGDAHATEKAATRYSIRYSAVLRRCAGVLSN